MLSRRTMLLSLGAAAMPIPSLAGVRALTLRPGPAALQVGGKQVEMLGFNGSCPGPEIRLPQNDTLRVRIDNGLQDGTLVHWHGIRLPNRMDGVNVLTQDVIIPGEAFDYAFPVPDAGTYWYHSHYLSYEQVARGLLGPLIVEERTPPDVDRDVTAMLFDILLDNAGQFDEEFPREDFATLGRMGNVKTAFLSAESVRLGDRVRLRIINPVPDRIFTLEVTGLSGRCVAFDGMPLASPLPIETLVLAPGQRVDIIGDVVGEVDLRDAHSGEGLARLPIQGTREKRIEPVGPLPANPVPRPGKVAQTVDLVMQGGAGGGTHGGFGTWAFNDVSGLPQAPLLSARRGETVRLRLRNETPFPHGIHLHGHHFWETDAAGDATYLRDTSLVAAGDTAEVLCVFDNPGAWMIHCHMLSHQADGMATWVRVT